MSVSAQEIQDKLWEKINKKEFAKLLGTNVLTVTAMENNGTIKDFEGGSRFLVEILNEIRAKQWSVFRYASENTQRRIRNLCDLAFSKNITQEKPIIELTSCVEPHETAVVAKNTTTQKIKKQVEKMTNERKKEMKKRDGRRMPNAQEIQQDLGRKMSLSEFSLYIGYGENFIKQLKKYLPPNGRGKKNGYTLKDYLTSLMKNKDDIKAEGYEYIVRILDICNTIEYPFPSTTAADKNITPPSHEVEIPDGEPPHPSGADFVNTENKIIDVIKEETDSRGSRTDLEKLMNIMEKQTEILSTCASIVLNKTQSILKSTLPLRQ